MKMPEIILVGVGLLVGLYSSNSWAGAVIQVKENRILISVEEGEFQAGEDVTIATNGSEKKGTAKIVQVKRRKAIADITSGEASVGMIAYKAYKRPGSEFNSGNSGNRFNIIFEPSGGVFQYKLSQKFSLGVLYYGAELQQASSSTTTTVGMSIMGARFSWYISEQGFSDSWYLAADGGTSGISISKAYGTSKPLVGEVSGSMFGLSYGYHWFWEHFNFALGLRYFQTGIKSISITNGTSTEAYNNLPASTMGLELGFGIAF